VDVGSLKEEGQGIPEGRGELGASVRSQEIQEEMNALLRKRKRKGERLQSNRWLCQSR
jgi:hypothetical protein